MAGAAACGRVSEKRCVNLGLLEIANVREGKMRGLSYSGEGIYVCVLQGRRGGRSEEGFLAAVVSR